MNEYYYIPKKKPRVPGIISIFDIILLVLAIVLGYMLIPIDLAVGISGTSRERAEGIELLIDDSGVEKGYFEALFDTGTRFPYVQKDDKYGTYLIYKDGKYESFDYEKGRKTVFGRSSRDNVPVGFVSSSGLTAFNDGTVYFENFKGFYGEAETDFNESLYTNGEFDFEKVTEILSNSDFESVSLCETAAIYNYMQNGTIVGYSDGTAWYVAKNGDEGYHLLSDNISEPVRLALNLGAHVKSVRVIENKYLMYITDGDIFIYINEENSKKLDCGDEVLGIDYSVDEDGKVSIYAYTQAELYRFDMTGNGVEYENLTVNDIDKPDGMYITKHWGKTMCWLRYGDKYSIYEN